MLRFARHDSPARPVARQPLENRMPPCCRTPDGELAAQMKQALGHRMSDFILHTGRAGRLAVQAFSSAFTPPLNLRLWLKEVYAIGAQSLGVVALIALFTGMVLGLQTAYGLARFGAKLYVGTLVAMSIVRELGPVLTGVIVAGRIASGIAAEIGSMQVSEQIDAIRALGASPVKKLVAPKVMAGMICLPLLTVFADVVGILGGMIVATLELHIGGFMYMNTVYEAVTVADFFSGIAKTVFFGFIITLMGCHFGLHAEQGTAGVGRATTTAVVTASVLIMLSDLVLTKLFLLL